jgi:uncharacterized protein YkwD
MRVPFVKALLACAAAALFVATPAAAGGLPGALFGLEPVGIQAFEVDPVPAPDVPALDLAAQTGPSAAAAPPIAVAALDVNDAVLAEINFARANPQAYARALLDQPVSDWERGLAEHTDRAAYAEAVAFLLRQAPLRPLRADDRLAAAALEHVAAQGAAGQVGHAGPGGEAFDARLRRHGVEARMWGENIAYGPARPSDVVRELIIDSGVPDRGHRRNIFYADFAAAGVSCGPHRDYAAMCVMDFAALPPPARPQSAPWRQAELAPAARPAGFLSRLLSFR